MSVGMLLQHGLPGFSLVLSADGLLTRMVTPRSPVMIMVRLIGNPAGDHPEHPPYRVNRPTHLTGSTLLLAQSLEEKAPKTSHGKVEQGGRIPTSLQMN